MGKMAREKQLQSPGVFDRLLSDVKVRRELFVGRCWKARRRNEYK